MKFRNRKRKGSLDVMYRKLKKFAETSAGTKDMAAIIDRDGNLLTI